MADVGYYVLRDGTEIGITVFDDEEAEKASIDLDKAVRRLEDKVELAGKVLTDMRESLTSVIPSGAQVTIEAGFSVGGKAGVIFTEGTAEAAFKIAMTWTKG